MKTFEHLSTGKKYPRLVPDNLPNFLSQDEIIALDYLYALDEKIECAIQFAVCTFYLVPYPVFQDIKEVIKHSPIIHQEFVDHLFHHVNLDRFFVVINLLALIELTRRSLIVTTRNFPKLVGTITMRVARQNIYFYIPPEREVQNPLDNILKHVADYRIRKYQKHTIGKEKVEKNETRDPLDKNFYLL